MHSPEPLAATPTRRQPRKRPLPRSGNGSQARPKIKQRVYLVGTGVISHHHAGAAAALPRETELYAADPALAALDHFGQHFPHARLFGTSDEMLAAEDPREGDIVCISTPPRFHAPEAMKALRSGRNVLCEKPLAMNVTEAGVMVGEAGRRGLHIACCSNRFMGWDLNLKAAEIVRSGALRKVYLADWIQRQTCLRSGIEYQQGHHWFLDQTQSGGGVLMDWGPYDFAVRVSLFDLVRVTVSDALCEQPAVPTQLPPGTVFDVETQAVASLVFEAREGGRVLVRYERTSATHGEPCDQSCIYGTEGFLRWDWLPFTENPRLLRRRTTGQTPPEETVGQVRPSLDRHGWMQAPLREFNRYLRGDPGACGLFDAQAFRPFLILQAVYEAAASRRSVSVEFD